MLTVVNVGQFTAFQKDSFRARITFFFFSLSFFCIFLIMQQSDLVSV